MSTSANEAMSMSEVPVTRKSSRRGLQITAVALSAGAVLLGGVALGASGASGATVAQGGSPMEECEGSGYTSYDKIEFDGTSSGAASITYTNNWSGTWTTTKYAVRVVVKSGSQSDPSATGVPGYSGTWTTGSEKQQDLSHITFCYGTEETSSPSPTSPSPTTPAPTTPAPTTPAPTTPAATTPVATTTSAAAAATTASPTVTATPLPAEVTAAPLPAEVTAAPSAAKVEKPKPSAKPLPAGVPAGGGGESGNQNNGVAAALILLGGLGLVLSTGWLALKR